MLLILYRGSSLHLLLLPHFTFSANPMPLTPHRIVVHVVLHQEYLVNIFRHGWVPQLEQQLVYPRDIFGNSRHFNPSASHPRIVSTWLNRIKLFDSSSLRKLVQITLPSYTLSVSIPSLQSRCVPGRKGNASSRYRNSQVWVFRTNRRLWGGERPEKGTFKWSDAYITTEAWISWGIHLLTRNHSTVLLLGRQIAATYITNRKRDISAFRQPRLLLQLNLPNERRNSFQVDWIESKETICVCMLSPLNDTQKSPTSGDSTIHFPAIPIPRVDRCCLRQYFSANSPFSPDDL